ncbi:transmembrane efflux protein [Streptomyces laurentii]|uniref:Transmembrane efflux protein n=1 Tax=Streptomyces laurentii TaxID=39478 RepID=A0A160P4M2_STRLU|nr:transmembrane efflux protein [Streptomyces laurentii]
MGVQAGLARLQLDEVEDLGLAAEDQVVEAQQHPRARTDGGGGPGDLGGTGSGICLGDVLGRGLGQVRQLVPGEGGVVGGTAGADDPRVSRATSSGVTTSAASRAPAGAGAAGLVPAARSAPEGVVAAVEVPGSA